MGRISINGTKKNRRAQFGVIVLGYFLSTYSAVAGSENYVGDQVLSQEEIVNFLAPDTDPANEAVLTRGIKTRSIGLKSGASTIERKDANISMGITFNYDSEILTESAKEQLSPLGQALATNDRLTSLDFILEGHTDSVGPEIYNMDLSLRRALAVQDYLASEFGVSRSRLTVSGKGESSLMDVEHPRSGKNRRVIIKTQ